VAAFSQAPKRRHIFSPHSAPVEKVFRVFSTGENTATSLREVDNISAYLTANDREPDPGEKTVPAEQRGA
jgi:hypothetical protein